MITEELGEALAVYASQVPKHQAIVEVGSFKGKSTCYLAVGAQHGHGAPVYAVDPWDTRGNVTGRFGFAEPPTREAFDRQVRSRGLEEHITPIKGFSSDVASDWSGPEVGMLYIDGDHTARGVRTDWKSWKRWLVPGAIVAFDDLDTQKNPGVRVVLDFLLQSGELEWVDKVAERLGVTRCPR